MPKPKKERPKPRTDMCIHRVPPESYCKRCDANKRGAT